MAQVQKPDQDDVAVIRRPMASEVDHELPVSVLIPAKDEEDNIVDCIRSLDRFGEIVVLDSLSADRTVERARSAEAAVVERRFDDHATHKNWALDNVRFRYPWILIVDADERATPELTSEIESIVLGDRSRDGYYIPRQNWFDGVWLRHAGRYPDYQLRLFRQGCGRYERRIVHEHLLLNGTVGHLRNPLIHLNDNKGMRRYLERQIRYAQMEAIEAHKLELGSASRDLLTGDVLARGPGRRRALKNLAYRHVPARPLWVFLWMYVIKLGFVHGLAGLRYCAWRMMYEFQVDLFLHEHRRAYHGQEQAPVQTEEEPAA
jgi:glycosyltransferase involved in cell wall biosynthesis